MNLSKSRRSPSPGWDAGWNVPWVLAGLSLACWPVFRWWLDRVLDRSDDPLGLAALLLAGAFLYQRADTIRIQPWNLALAAGILLIQAVLPLPPLIRAGAMILSLILALSLLRKHPGIAWLLFLSLPVVASLQFFAGFPMRLITASLANGMLSILGLEVERTGTLLLWQGREIGVDAACSGIQLLWAACFAAAGLSARFRLNPRRNAFLVLAAIGLILLLNGLRSAILFFPGAGMVMWPEWTHEATGLALFLVLAILLAQLAQRWAEPPPLPAGAAGGLTRSTLAGWAVACLAAASLSWVHRTGAATATPPVPPDFPLWFEGERLAAVPLSPSEARFASGFPGSIQVGRSSSGRTVILRHVREATRSLHPAAGCLKAAGATVHPLPGWKDDLGRTWGQCSVELDGSHRKLRELITDSQGRHYPDPQSWFWPAALGQSQGPWTSISVLE